VPLTSPIRAYDPAWPDRYAEEAARLAPVFGPLLVALHHVGSTAVPGLAAKPEIDILAIVDCDGVAEAWTGSLRDLGYRRGGDLAPGHGFFKRDVGGLRTHKLHVCSTGHPAAAGMLRFRDHLRRDPAGRRRYEALKLRLEAANRDGIAEYLDGKRPYIQSVLDELG